MLIFLKDLLAYRLVFGQLVAQHLSLRYRRTWLGFLWTLANPLLTMLVTSVVFSLMLRFPLKNFAVFLFSGLIPWTLLSSCISQGGNAILENENLVKKIYLPKQTLVLSKCVALLCEASLSFFALFCIAITIGAPLTKALLLLPIAFLLLFLFASGIALVMSVLCVYFRDMAHISSIVLQAGYYATPIIYPVSIVPEQFQKWFTLNPMFHFIELFRTIVYLGDLPNTNQWIVCCWLATASLFFGMLIMQKYSKKLIFRL